MGRFEPLTEYIQEIKAEVAATKMYDGTPEHSAQMPHIDHSGIGSRFQESFYRFCKDNPEFEIENPFKVLAKNGVVFDLGDVGFDASGLDAMGIIALIDCIIDANKQCPVILLPHLKQGTILSCLERLKEIDNGD